MAEVNQVPETAVSPEITDNFSRPATGPYVHPTPPSMRAITPIEEPTHTVDYDAFNQKYRVGTPDNPNPVPGAPRSLSRPEDVMLVAAAGAPRVVGAAVARTAAALGGKVPAALYRQAALERRFIEKSLTHEMDQFAAHRTRDLAKDLGVSPGLLGRFAPGTAPEDIRIMRLANRTVAGLDKPGFKPLMPPGVAKDLVAAQNAYYDAATPFLQTGSAPATASRDKLLAAYVALRKPLGEASKSLAAQKSPAGALASSAGGFVASVVKNNYRVVGRFLAGVRHYDKYGELTHGFRTPLGLTFDKIGDAFIAANSPVRELWHRAGSVVEGTGRTLGAAAIVRAITKPSRDKAAAEAGDKAAAEAYRRAYGVEPPKATTPAAPAPQVAPAAPSRPTNPYDAAFMF